VPVEDLTYMLPEPMRNPAFIDSVHGILNVVLVIFSQEKRSEPLSL
jgi:predicted ATP-dependent Lon-type protease